jgi:hypothetical protein
MSFIRELLDPTKNLSFGRFMALVITAFVLGWDTSHLVFAWRFNLHLSPGMQPLSLFADPLIYAAQGAFCALFYSVTKTGDVLGTKVNSNG